MPAIFDITGEYLITKLVQLFFANCAATLSHPTASSTNAEVQFLIDELKKTYNTFIKQFEKKEA